MKTGIRFGIVFVVLILMILFLILVFASILFSFVFIEAESLQGSGEVYVSTISEDVSGSILVNSSNVASTNLNWSWLLVLIVIIAGVAYWFVKKNKRKVKRK